MVDNEKVATFAVDNALQLMTFVILSVLIVAYFLIATGKWTGMNKAAVAMFAGTLGWVLYISYGADFVMDRYAYRFEEYLGGLKTTSEAVKYFIASNIFLKYIGQAAEIVLFLLATMTIVEILHNNGCFDFLRQLLKTRSSKRFLWMLALITFVLSANLDNLTTTVMMLTLMHDIVQSRRQRMVLGAAIVIAANCGGVLTVIGDPSQLLIWNKGAVTATNYSLSLALPCLISWMLPTYLLSRMLPERIDTKWITMPYRGDDTNLKVWQRFVMLVVGIGGLWFIPTFHDITKLPPFLGALCVLAILWIVNEIMNRRLMDVDKMIERRIPRQLQYGTLQLMLFIVGMVLMVGVVTETGLVEIVRHWLNTHAGNVWAYGLVAGAVSTVLDNFATASSAFSLFPVTDDGLHFCVNGQYWKVVAYCSAVGGNVLAIGSMSGMAYLKMERVHLGWFIGHVGWKALLGALGGLGVLACVLI